MKYLGYSELTKRIYILPASKKAAKVDITEDIKELMAFFKKDTFSILSDQITALQSSLKEKDQEIEKIKMQRESYKSQAEHFSDDLEELKAENERLKAERDSQSKHGIV